MWNIKTYKKKKMCSTYCNYTEENTGKALTAIIIGITKILAAAKFQTLTTFQ